MENIIANSKPIDIIQQLIPWLKKRKMAIDDYNEYTEAELADIVNLIKMYNTHIKKLLGV